MGVFQESLLVGSNANIAAFSVLFGLFIIFVFRWLKAPEIPVVNDYRCDFFRTKAHKEFMTDAKALIARGFKEFNNGPFRIITPLGSRVIMPIGFQDWVKTSKDLDHPALVMHEYFGSYPGMEGISSTHDPSNILIDVVRNKLNQKGQCELFQEHITEALSESWTDEKEWHPVDWSSDAMRFVGRMSASVFVGSELSRNPDWQNLTITYTTNAFFAIRSLRSLPGLVRPMIHWFLPECKKVREQVKHARSMLQPIIDKQRLARKSSSAGNQPKYHDTIGWMEETAAGRPFDPEAAQLGFALSALHTTSNLMKQALYDICLHPELIQPLRDEVSKAVSENGWSTAGVFQMQLLDSVIKESQRLKPAGLVNLERKALHDIVMPNGVKLPRGTNIAVDTSVMWTSQIYDNPETFDGYRFLKIRQGGVQGSSTAALASSSPEHFDFGLGRSICPGRFFAANEVKVALASILMNYDVRLRDNQKPQVLHMGFELLADLMGQIEVRRR